MKFGDQGDHFNLKITIFVNNYSQYNVPLEARALVFLTILKRAALDFYYTAGITGRLYKKMITILRSNFKRYI